MKLQEGKSYNVNLPNGKNIKIHVDYILPSKCYDNEEIIVYRYYKRNRWEQEVIEKYKFDMYNETN